MHTYDVFYGDADGICALIQLRLAKPCESTLVAGVKRDIALAKKVHLFYETKVRGGAGKSEAFGGCVA